MKNVALLTSQKLSSVIIANEICKHIKISIIICEERKKKNTLKNKLKKLMGDNLLYWISMFRYNGVKKNILKAEYKLKLEAKKLYSENFKHSDWPDNNEVFKTSSINGRACIKKLKSLNIDLIIVNGTGILKNELLSIPTIGTINCHTSILPHYRGTFVEFWQIYYDDLSKAGITIHFVNQGVDTGDIIFQKSHDNISQIKNPYELRALNTCLTAKYFGPVAKTIIDNSYTSINQKPCKMKTFRIKDLTLAKKEELYRRLKLII